MRCPAYASVWQTVSGNILHSRATLLPGSSITAVTWRGGRIVDRLMRGFDADSSRLIKSTGVERAVT